MSIIRLSDKINKISDIERAAIAMSLFPFSAHPDEVVLVGFRPMTLRVAVQMHADLVDVDGAMAVVAFRDLSYRPSTLGASELERLGEFAAFTDDP